jgi:hypothetical protein
MLAVIGDPLEHRALHCQRAEHGQRIANHGVGLKRPVSEQAVKANRDPQAGGRIADRQRRPGRPTRRAGLTASRSRARTRATGSRPRPGWSAGARRPAARTRRQSRLTAPSSISTRVPTSDTRPSRRTNRFEKHHQAKPATQTVDREANSRLLFNGAAAGHGATPGAGDRRAVKCHRRRVPRFRLRAPSGSSTSCGRLWNWWPARRTRARRNPGHPGRTADHAARARTGRAADPAARLTHRALWLERCERCLRARPFPVRASAAPATMRTTPNARNARSQPSGAPRSSRTWWMPSSR